MFQQQSVGFQIANAQPRRVAGPDRQHLAVGTGRAPHGLLETGFVPLIYYRFRRHIDDEQAAIVVCPISNEYHAILLRNKYDPFQIKLVDRDVRLLSTGGGIPDRQAAITVLTRGHDRRDLQSIWAKLPPKKSRRRIDSLAENLLTAGNYPNHETESRIFAGDRLLGHIVDHF